MLARANELTDMQKTEGYKKLSAQERARLDALVGGTTSASKNAPGAMRTLLDDAGLDKTKAETFQKFITDEKYLNFDARLPGEKRLTTRPYKLGPPKDVKDHPFHSGTADAVMRMAEIEWEFWWRTETASIPIYAPKTFTPPKPERVLPSHDDIAKVLAELPEESMFQVRRVDLNPKPNPADAMWAADPNYNPGGGEFVSHMTANVDGRVDVYPASANKSLVEIETTMLHETGHSFSGRWWGHDNSKASWDKWKAAMKADGMNVSTYGKSSPNEDFAEAWTLWLPNRGTAAEKEIKALIPNRVKLMEEMIEKWNP